MTISYRTFAGAMFMSAFVGIMVNAALTGLVPSQQASTVPVETTANTGAVTVEEVYQDTRVSVYRLVDHDTNIVCYWTYEGNTSCQNILPNRYR